MPNSIAQKNNLLPSDAGKIPALVQSPKKGLFDDLKPGSPRRDRRQKTLTKSTEPAITKVDKTQMAYGTWSRNPIPMNMSGVVSSLEPTIQKAIKTYSPGGDNPIVRGRARVLAMGAIKSFDPARKVKLETHVMNQLQGLRRYSMAAATATRKSERHYREYWDLKKAEEDYYFEHGEEPSDQELADMLGISVRKINTIRKYATQEIGTGRAEGITGEDEEAGDGVGVYEVDPEEIWMDYVYHDLTPVDRKIMDWKLGKHGKPVLPNVEIARKLRITPAAVTQRAARISKRLEEGMMMAAQRPSVSREDVF